MMSYGILGAGGWGRNHVRVALELKEEGLISEVHVCDIDPSRLKPWESRAATASSLREMLDAHVEAVTIATPADTHYELARQCLEAGVHTLVEKPMTIRAGDAKRLVELADKMGVVAMPGHVFRYHPGIREVKARIDKGWFGRLRYLATSRTSFTPPRTDVGVLYSLTIHEADLYAHLLGCKYPDRARSETASFRNPNIDEVAYTAFHFPGPCLATSISSWITPGPAKVRSLTIVGTRGSAEVDYAKLDSIQVQTATMEEDPRSRFEEGARETIQVRRYEPLREEVSDFLRASGSGGRLGPLADAASGARAIEVIEALKTVGAFVPKA